MKRFVRILALAGAVAVGLLAGCATNVVLDSTVQSFSGLPALPAAPTYRFERLPLQQAQPGQDQVEALADPALFKAGLRRDDAAPRLQRAGVGARAAHAVALGRPVGRLGMGPSGYPWGRRWGPGFGAAVPPRRPDLVPARSGRRGARHRQQQGGLREPGRQRRPLVRQPSGARRDVRRRMAGFPNPPQGVRRVSVQLVDPKAQAAAPLHRARRGCFRAGAVTTGNGAALGRPSQPA
jgi:hypothetical protein